MIISNTSDDPGLRTVINVCLKHRNVDLRTYRPNFLTRRINTRLKVRGAENLLQYASILEKDPEESIALFKALSINVTEFYRDKDTFDAFSNFVVQELSEKYSVSRLKLWSAGCASGEEAYSLVILLKEALAEIGVTVPFEVIGTDISSNAIENAILGRYASTKLKNLPKRLIEKYFLRNSESDVYEVVDDIRKHVKFGVADLSKNIIFRNLDVIFCRNTFIYFTKEMQNDILERFHNCLKQSGILVIGKSETILGKPISLFEPVFAKERIYRKIPSLHSPHK